MDAAASPSSRWRRRLRAPRRLRPTREGKWLLGITLAAGFAALNTGNNLLFFGWGLLLASVLISGLLSEATLRVIRVRPLPIVELRAGARGPLPLELRNVGRRLPAFGVEIGAKLEDPSGRERAAHARYHLRLEPSSRDEVLAHDHPTRRGVHRLIETTAGTRYPFGFFVKSRAFPSTPPIEVVVYPRRVDTRAVGKQLLSRIGAVPTKRQGPGEEFFSLRPYREGDDPRRIHWRRSARADRLQVKETESEASRHVVVEVCLGEDPPGAVEEALAFAGSLAEDLLQQGHAVGLWGPGVALPPARGGRQRAAVLTELARLDEGAPRPPPPSGPHVARAAVVTPSAPRPAGASLVHEVDAGPEAAA